MATSSALAILASQVQSTAGAIPVVNEKGEISMQKVKVHRYISGRRPKYAPEESSEEESGDDFPFERKQQSRIQENVPIDKEAENLDPRLRRLKRKLDEDVEDSVTNRIERHRHIHEPEVITLGAVSDLEDDVEETATRRWHDEEESSEEEELDDEQIERRRSLLRIKAREKAAEEELLDVEDENKSEAEESEESEYEEYSDSEEEMGQRLKPVFVRKKDRITVKDKEQEALKQRDMEHEVKRIAEERRRHTLKMIEEENRKDSVEELGLEQAAALVITDDENDEAAYESWKLRELKRIKRDKEEREKYEKERMEIERLHNMTEEERRAEQRNNPRQVTNKGAKGKYKFLQKYYHRGAFFMDDEEGVFKRDFSAPTLEDHFNKTVLPKVMQVKNFGRSGRTKYTHLADQDTTLFDSPWVVETTQNSKFNAHQAGGMKQLFERPSTKKRKK